MAGIRSRVVGGAWEEHDVGDRPLTLLCHKGDIQIDVPDAIEINFDTTRYHGKRVVKIDPVALAWIEYILGFQLERDLQPSDRPDSQAHCIGMVDLPIKLMQKAGHGLPIFLKEPETSLHPSQQSRIADFLACMTNHVDNETGRFDKYPEGYDPNNREPWSI